MVQIHFTGCLALCVLKTHRLTILCRVFIDIYTNRTVVQYFAMWIVDIDWLLRFHGAKKSIKRYLILLTVEPIFPRRKTCPIRLRQDRSENTDSDAVVASFIKLPFPTSVDVVCLNFKEVVPTFAPTKTIFLEVNSPVSWSSCRYRNRHTEATIYIIVVKDTNFPKARTNLIWISFNPPLWLSVELF